MKTKILLLPFHHSSNLNKMQEYRSQPLKTKDSSVESSGGINSSGFGEIFIPQSHFSGAHDPPWPSLRLIKLGFAWGPALLVMYWTFNQLSFHSIGNLQMSD
jgi:hypothetical protein